MEVLQNPKSEIRNNNYHKSFDAEKMRRQREEGLIQLRKQKRSSHILKKRALQHGVQEADCTEGGFLQFEASLVPSELAAACPDLTNSSISPQIRSNLLIRFITTVKDQIALFQSIQTLRKILSADAPPPLLFILNSSVSKILIQQLNSENKDMKIECLWCILNLATGPKHMVEDLVKSGLIPVLSPLLDSSEQDLLDMTVWCIGNLAADSNEVRDQLVGLTPKLTALLQKVHSEKQKNIVWTLSNLCRGKPLPEPWVTDEILKVLPRLLRSQETAILADCCWALSYISDGDNQRIQDIIALGIIPTLIGLINEEESVSIPCLRTLGNIVTGTEGQTQIALNCGLVDKISFFLSSSRVSMKREALWTLSNITAGNDEQINLVLSHPCMSLVIECLKEADFEIKKEALWVVSNATHAKSPEIVLKVMNLGAFGPICDILDHRDSKILMIVLEAINNLLKAGSFGLENEGKINEVAVKFDEIGGLAKLEDLQEHPNTKIYKKVVEIMEEYYGLIEVNNENTEPVSGQFVFQ